MEVIGDGIGGIGLSSLQGKKYEHSHNLEYFKSSALTREPKKSIS